MLRLLQRTTNPQWRKRRLPSNPQRDIHSRNKKAMEFVAKGWSALQEVDRVIDHTELRDPRLIPLLRTARENFELALEVDNMNTHARYWLSRLHFKYHVPGACKAVGAALLIEAANMGDADAQHELGCRLRVENENVQSDQQAFYYIEKAVDQLHPGALYLLGAVFLAGDCVEKDISSAMWCFCRASEKVGPGEVDDELEEEVASECTKYGTVTRVLIFKITEANFPPDEAVRIFVQLERSEETTKAIIDLDGWFFAGRVVKASFVDEERFGRTELAPVPGEIPGFKTCY